MREVIAKKFLYFVVYTTFMYLSYAGSKGNKYYKIVESARDESGKPRQNTILYLGRLTEQEAERVRRWLDAYPIDAKREFIICPTEEISIDEARDAGDIKLIEALWSLLRLDEIIDTVHPDCGSQRSCKEILLSLVANRCIEPKSKLAFVDWLKETELIEHFESLDSLHVNAVYRAMDHIEKIKLDMEIKILDRLKKLFDVSTDVLLYDLTSSFFTGEGPEEAKKGHSRDHRPDCNQVNWGLVATPEGFPITHQVYEGNRLDKTTVKSIRKHLEQHFGVKECIFVADRGMLTISNLKILKSDGNKFILADRERSVKEKVLGHLENNPLNEFEKVKDNLYVSEYWTTEIWKAEEESEEEGEKEADEEVRVRYIVCYNPDKVSDNGKGTDNWLERGKNQLRAVEKMVKNGRLKDHDKVVARVVKKLTKVHMDGYFDFQVPPSPVESFEWWVLKEKAKDLEKMRGIWVVKTNIRDDEMTAREIALQYKRLRMIERIFKIIKVFNQVRPINHYRKRRVDCHIFICILSYLLERVLEFIMERRSENVIGHRLIRTFHNVKSVEVKAGEYTRRLTTPYSNRQKSIFDYIETTDDA